MEAIQELIDENRDKMPVGLAKELLDLCQEEYKKPSKLYRVKMSVVRSVVYYVEDDEDHSKMVCHSQTCLYEEAPHPGGHFSRAFELFHCHGQLHPQLLYPHRAFPEVLGTGDLIYIIHSIVPYVPKRDRE